MLNNTARMKAVAEANLLLSENAEFLQELIDLLQQVVGAPIALVSFVTENAQEFKAQHGLPSPYNTTLTTPLSHSFCQHVVTTGEQLRIDDAPNNPLVCDNLAITDMDVKAYAGTPILNPDGYVLGSLCAIDTKPRSWTDKDVSVLKGFARTITAELSSRRAQQLRLDEEWVFNTNSRALVQALKATKSGVWFWNAESQKSYWPDETCALFGFDKDNYPATLSAFLDYLSEGDQARMKAMVNSLSPENPDYNLEVMLKSPLWDVAHWIRTSGQVHFDTSGEISEVVGFMSIIDEAKRAARRTERLAARFKRLTNHAPVMIAELDTALRYIFANNSYASMFGTTAEKIIGKHARDVLGAENFANAEAHMKSAVQGQSVEYDLTLFEDDPSSAKYLKVRYAPEFSLSDSGDDVTVTSFIAAIIDNSAEVLSTRKATALGDRLTAAHRLSPDGFMMFTAIRDSRNKITDFTFEYANEAGAKIAGRDVGDMIGRKLLDVLPGNKKEGLFDGYVNVVETGQPFETENFYNHDGIELWLEITAIKVSDGFAVAFSDITRRKRQEIEIEQTSVRLQRVLDNVIAFVGTLTTDGVLTDVNDPALAVAKLSREDVIGKPFWDAYWWGYSTDIQAQLQDAVATARAGKSCRYDVKIRVANGEHMIIDFQLNPVFSSSGKVIELIASGIDISDRLKAEAHRDLLINELNHRVKNSLATIQAMARQTIRSSDTLDGFEATFSARLSAIAGAHDIVMASDQGRASLKTMIERQVGPYMIEGDSRLKLDGKDVMLSGPSAHALGLVLHELSTNAAKYGALSNKMGRIDISWIEDADGLVHINWQEIGGPPVAEPSRRGFGTRLIKQSLEYSLGGSANLDYRKDGFCAKLSLPKEAQDG